MELYWAGKKEKFMAHHAGHYDNDPDYQLPEPKPLMTAKSYHEKIAVPLVQRLKNVIRSLLSQFFEQIKELKTALDRANRQNWNLSERLEKVKSDNERLKGVETDYNRLHKFLRSEKVEGIISSVKEQEALEKKLVKK